MSWDICIRFWRVCTAAFGGICTQGSPVGQAISTLLRRKPQDTGQGRAHYLRRGCPRSAFSEKSPKNDPLHDCSDVFISLEEHSAL
jgi:hypothetical protein